MPRRFFGPIFQGNGTILDSVWDRSLEHHAARKPQVCQMLRIVKFGKKCGVFGKVPLLWHRILCLAFRAWFKTFYCAQSIFCATKTVQIWFKISDHNRWCSIVTKKVWNLPKMGNFGSQSLKLSQEYIQEISEETGCELFILIKAEQLYLCFTSTL